MTTFTVPTSIDVFVPKLGETVSVDLTPAGDDILMHLLHHGLKQKLVDATAGVNAADFTTKDDYTAKVRATVAARLETILTIPSERAFGPRNPVETESRRIVAELLLKWKVAAKRTAAQEMASTYAKATEAFRSVIAAATAKANPGATDDQIQAVVERQWAKLVHGPAEEIVLARSSAPVDMGDLTVD